MHRIPYFLNKGAPESVLGSQYYHHLLQVVSGPVPQCAPGSHNGVHISDFSCEPFPVTDLTARVKVP